MAEQPFKCVVAADLFWRASLGISHDECRYYLNGVHVSESPDGGAVLAGTDGNMLIAINDPEAIVEGSAIVSLNKDLLRLVKARPAKWAITDRFLVVTGHSTKANAFVVDVERAGKALPDGVSSTSYQIAELIAQNPDERVQAVQFGSAVINGTFPDWRKIVPTELKPMAPAPRIDVTLLQRAAEALSFGKGRRPLVLTPSSFDQIAPVFVTRPSSIGPRGFAVVMPGNWQTGDIATPSWARNERPAGEQEAA